jgi:hypothetical protein
MWYAWIDRSTDGTCADVYVLPLAEWCTTASLSDEA